MPVTLDERLTKAKEHVAKLEKQRREEARREREAEKKKDQRRNYIFGEIVAKHFPETSRLEPGTKAENAVEFEPFDLFLSLVADHRDLRELLKNEIDRRMSLKNQDQ